MTRSSTTLLKRQKIKRRKKKIQRSVLPLFILITLFFCSLIFFVWSRLQITYLGYEISQVNKEQKQFLNLNKQLKLEAASLESLARIENIARKQLGLVNPKSHQMVFTK
jgi:cell division protein FtsL